jgi:hypothetical protein
MKASRNLVALAGGSLLLAASAFAAAANKGTLHLYENVEVQGKQLTPGDYKLEWNGEGPTVQLNITSGKRTVATVPAQLISSSEKAQTDGYSEKKADDGQNALTEIFFGGKNYELRLGDQTSSAPANSGNAASNK